MPLDIDALRAWQFEELEQHYTPRDTILYALGLGYGADPLDRGELRFVYEADLQAVPSMAAVLASPGFWLKHPRSGVNWRKVLHGEQWLDILRPLPPEGRVIGRMKIEAIADKGAGKAAVIYQSREIVDADSGDVLARVRHSSFCRGEGGFGGQNIPGPAPAAIPDRPPDQICDLPTSPRQALIYRLSGDLNPLHVDPDVARAAGFGRPILHGLSTYGMAARALLRVLCDQDAARLRGLDVRFSAPVFPGETVRFEIWQEGAEARFRARVPARDALVLDNGAARFF